MGERKKTRGERRVTIKADKKAVGQYVFMSYVSVSNTAAHFEVKDRPKEDIINS